MPADDLPPLTSVPLGQAPFADEEPDERPAWQRLGRRKPGRKSNAERGVEGAPRQRRERAPARGQAPRKPSVGSLRTRIGGALTMANMVVMVIPRAAPDALSPVEIDALAKGIDAQCQQSPRFRKYVEAALSTSGAGGLVGIVAMIAARRASRHGIIPPFIDGAIGAMIGDTASPLTPQPDGQAVAEPNTAGSAPDGTAPMPDLPPLGAPALPTLGGNGIARDADAFDFEDGSFVRVP